MKHNKIIHIIVVICFCTTLFLADGLRLTAQAQGLDLPAPTQMIPLSHQFSHPVLKGLQLDSNDPLTIKFIIEGGDKKQVSEDESAKLVRYFLAALTTPSI